MTNNYQDPRFHFFMAAVSPEWKDFFDSIIEANGISTFKDALAEIVHRYGIEGTVELITAQKNWEGS